MVEMEVFQTLGVGHLVEEEVALVIMVVEEVQK